MAISLTRLKAIFDERFGPPFLPAGEVKATWVKLAPKDGRGERCLLKIKIGRRDVEIDARGNISASGTDVTRAA